jgi:uroporphyrin-III C-methyltransferase / precorrin-2 dehydrogenase / sirohydrochlorin ferrochelatase
LPALIDQVEGGPAILVVGDVVAHSAPWRRSKLSQVITGILEAAE